MTAESMRWLLRLMRLRNIKNECFLINFARHMCKVTEGVPRDCWREVVIWAGIPELLVNMTLEVEIDNLLSKPMNKLFYERVEGRPCGFVIHKMPKVVHNKWRPQIERLVSDPLKVLKATATAIDRLPDDEQREVKKKQVGKVQHTQINRELSHISMCSCVLSGSRCSSCL